MEKSNAQKKKGHSRGYALGGGIDGQNTQEEGIAKTGTKKQRAV